MYEIFGFDPDNFKCVPCIKSKKLLEVKGLEFVFLPILKTGVSEESSKNKKELGKRRASLNLPLTGFTMPQIFKDGVYVGGFDELKESLK